MSKEVSEAYFSPAGGIYTIEVLGALAVAGYLVYEYETHTSVFDSIGNSLSNGAQSVGNFFSNGASTIGNWWDGLSFSNPFASDDTKPEGNPYNALIFSYNDWPPWMKDYYNYVGTQSAPVIAPSIGSLQQGTGEFAGSSYTDSGHITELENPDLQFTGETLQELNQAAAQLQWEPSSGLTTSIPFGGTILPSYTPPSATVPSIGTSPTTTQGSQAGNINIGQIANSINSEAITNYNTTQQTLQTSTVNDIMRQRHMGYIIY